MKVFVVVTERDGERTKKPGETTTKIRRSEYRFATDDIQAVWIRAMSMANEEETLVAVYEEHPSIIIL